MLQAEHYFLKIGRRESNPDKFVVIFLSETQFQGQYSACIEENQIVTLSKPTLISLGFD